jgi:hypothetical protein
MDRRWATIAHPADGHHTARWKRRQSFFRRELGRGTFRAGRAIAGRSWPCERSRTFFLRPRECDSGKVRSKPTVGGNRTVFQRDLFGSAGGMASRARHARRTSQPRENAIADRSDRSERRRESDGRANGEFRGPGFGGRTTGINPRRQDEPAIPLDPNAARLHPFDTILGGSSDSPPFQAAEHGPVGGPSFLG